MNFNRNVVSVAVAMMFAGSVNAAGITLPGGGDINTNTNTNLNTNTNANTNLNTNANANANFNTQGQQQGQMQGQLQGQQQGIFGSGNSSQGQGQDQSSSNENTNSASQNQSANNQGNTQVTNYNNVRQHRNTPNVYTVAPPATASCMSSFGTGAAASGLGLSFSGTYINEECMVLEASRHMNNIGQGLAAVEIACTSKYTKQTTLCKDLRKNETGKDVAAAKANGHVATASSANNLILDNDVVSNAATGEVYGKIVGNRYVTVNTIPYAYQNELSTLINQR